MYLPHLIQPQLQQYDEYFYPFFSDAWPFNSLMYLILPQYRHNMMHSLIHSYWYMASQQPNKGVTDRYSIWPSDDGLAETITLSKHHRELLSQVEAAVSISVTPSPPAQNGHHIVDNIFKWIFFNKKVPIWLKFHWSLFLRVQLTITQHWFR